MRQILIIMTAMLMACCSKESEMTAQDTLDYKMNITIYGQTKSVTLVDNAATKTLIEKLQQGPVTVTLNSSGVLKSGAHWDSHYPPATSR